ncbi:TPA: hypothetical protein ACWZSZ_004916, partial [Escherichia coli]
DLESVKTLLEQRSAAGKASAEKRKASKAIENKRISDEISTSVEIPLKREGNENPANKDNNKDLKDKNHLSEAEKIPLPTDEPVFISLPLSGGNDFFDVTESYLADQIDLYPAVNIEQEFRNMRGWLDSNPTRRKTAKGIRRFITTWLQKCQDSPRRNNGPAQGNAPIDWNNTDWINGVGQ